MGLRLQLSMHSAINWALFVQQLPKHSTTLTSTLIGAPVDAGRGAAKVPRQVTLNGVIYSDKVKSLADLRDDEDAAAAEALAQGGRPGYCGDRYFKAAAGGHLCK